MQPQRKQAEKAEQTRVQRQVLIVDDDASVAAVLMGMLKLNGFVGTRASSAAEARERAAAAHYDVALVDVGLRGECGEALAEELECEYGMPGRVILMTGGVAPRAERCVLKPFNYTQLLDMIAVLCDQCDAARPPLTES